MNEEDHKQATSWHEVEVKLSNKRKTTLKIIKLEEVAHENVQEHVKIEEEQESLKTVLVVRTCQHFQLAASIAHSVSKMSQQEQSYHVE